MHAYGAAFDNPGLTVACVIGDGEAETGPLATSWQSCKLLNAASDGAVLPILHLNGYKIAGPTVMGRMSDEDLRSLFSGFGYVPLFVEGDDPAIMHRLMAASLDEAFDRIQAIQGEARGGGSAGPARWPMIVLRSPKGWTGPKDVDGKRVEGFWRAHQVPVDAARDTKVIGGSLRPGCAATSWRRCSIPQAAFSRNSPCSLPKATAAWGRAPTPTAAS